MRKFARVVILKGKKILMIHRIRDSKEYYVLPGGGVEKGETPEGAAIREAKEEANLNIKLGCLLWKIKIKDNSELQEGYIFLARDYNGKIMLGNGPEQQAKSKDNVYLLERIDISELRRLTVYPSGLKRRLMSRFG
jgi:8-oxo-dGTP pyrophosphatase MutT (NUDIX family)